MTGPAHRWSGWPGAWCLDCGQEDRSELCCAEHDPDTCELPGCRNGPCPEPGSHLCDPYDPPSGPRQQQD